MQRPLVVAVSGYSGSGKSTLVIELAKELLSCVTLFFDDYVSRKDFPESIVSWIHSGGDPNEIKTPLLREHLICLINGESIILNKGIGWAEEYGNLKPKEKLELKPGEIILLEEPFGKERDEVADLIDLVIYLDVSPEVSLGRRIYDLIKNLKHDPEVLISLLDHFLSDYLYGGVKEMYLLNGIRVKEKADLIIDANQEKNSVVEQVKREILRTIRKL
ncbi:hypothetical protein J14TS5_18110 [Paenibacillus lautus]|uniref:uridine kinase family protein n=1 Tax=Paenibacillus TaxID=44249 RepID=UPI000BF84C2E|nr:MULTISPECIES: hypothetical protein [Paenibacillus]GIO96725.1 hypothetical protein J14TS5_18110 [Paenibacillus lautus]